MSPADGTKLKKIMIVIEEDGTRGGGGFQVYMAGDKERLQDQNLPWEKMTPAEYWGSILFQTAIQTLKQAGVVRETQEMQ